MLLSKKLLSKLNSQYANLSDELLTIGLNAIGVEVEQVIHFNVNPGLKVGKILSATAHPNSDHLNVCQVQIGDQIEQIVCGAPDLPIGFQVVVAPVGYEFPNGLKIAPREIRGVASHGMLCGYSELSDHFNENLAKNEANGIIRIDPNIKLDDKNLLSYLGLDDTVYDLSIPSNRNELNGAYWLAYELNAYFENNTPLLIPHFEDVKIYDGEDIQLEVLSNKVNTYSLIKFDLTKEYDYTRWGLKQVLINSGIHVTNTIADLGNFVTLLFANPLHMFDYDLTSKHIVVKRTLEPTEINGIDGKVYPLAAGTLVTMDDNGIIAATGLMGAKEYAVSENTKTVLVEITNIEPDFIRESARINKINTTSATLFSKPLAQYVTCTTCCDCVHRIFAENKLISNLSLIKKPKENKAVEIEISVDDINNLLGIELELDQIIDIFALTGFKYDGEVCQVPGYRLEIHNKADLCEEIMKSLDINEFPVQPIVAPILSFTKNEEYKHIQTVRNYLIHQQFIETKTYNLTSQKEAELFNWFKIKQPINIMNPLSNQREYLRTNLVHQMLEVLQYNINHKQPLANIFEVQKVSVDLEHTFNMLVVILDTHHFVNLLNKDRVSPDILGMQGIYNGLKNACGWQLSETYNVENLEGLYSQNNMVITKNSQPVGFMGMVYQDLLKKEYDINQPVCVLALNLDAAFDNISHQQTIIQAISEFNPIYKEFSFYNEHNVPLGPVFSAISKIQDVKAVDLYDTYIKDNLRSYTISVQIQSEHKTLTNDEIDNILNQIKQVLANYQLVIR